MINSKSKKKKTSFDKRLLSYSLAAGTLAAAPGVKADIQYTNVDPDSTCSSDAYLLDADGDGMTELVITHNSGSGSMNAIYAEGVNNAEILAINTSSTSYFTLALTKNEDISGQQTFADMALLGKVLSTTNSTYSSNQFYVDGYWPENEQRYLGFRFEKIIDSTSVDTLYGWVRLKLDSSFTKFTVYDYAFEDIAGKSIATGDTGETASAISLKSDIIPKEFTLHQNYPNPFNPSTKITFDLPKSQKIILSVYDLSGKLIAMLKNSKMSAGRHEIIWNGKNKNNSDVSSGMYIYELKAGKAILTKKMLLIR